MTTDKTAEDDIRGFIFESRNASNKDTSLLNLEKARGLLKKTPKPRNAFFYSYESEVLTEMARVKPIPSERSGLWNEALRTLSMGISELKDPALIDQFGRKTIDYLQDPFVNIMLNDAIHLLARAKQAIDDCSLDLPAETRSLLLARKSALIRQMAKGQTTRIQQEQMAQRALRCAHKAVEFHPDSWNSHLELGLTLWYASEFEKGDSEFHRRLEEAEQVLWKSYNLHANVFTLLTLSKYFRTTYQTLPCLECFEKYALIEHNKRRYNDESYIFAEGVMQFWYSSNPSEFNDSRMTDAERLLEQSIGYGNSNARHIIDLAFIKAALGNPDVGRKILRTLHNLSTDVSWTDIAVMVANIGPGDDLVARGFAIGITDSSTWNKLATFTIDFLNDIDLATALYREALRIQPSNAVVLTNLARSLLAKGDTHSLNEANLLISKAASCASRRFRWWRNIREQINQKLVEAGQKNLRPNKTSSYLKLKCLSDLHRTFQEQKNSADPQARGFLLEKLIYRLLNLSLGNAFSSYRAPLKWFNSPALQIDAGFCFFDKEFYRVESKWTSTPVTPNDIVLFRQKLDAVGVRGLFLSINGFTTEAVQTAFAFRGERQILLMDGEELEAILEGSPSLDEAIRLKQVHFAKDSNPYYRIRASKQVDSILN